MYSHMKSKIIKIGNSKGVRIPKALLNEAGLTDAVEITLTKKGLLIMPARDQETEDWLKLGLWSFYNDTNDPEEDKAWASLQ